LENQLIALNSSTRMTYHRESEPYRNAFILGN